MELFSFEDAEVFQWANVLVESRDGLYEYLNNIGINYKEFWHPLNMQSLYLLILRAFLKNCSGCLRHF